jgi:hypothetical protein
MLSQLSYCPKLFKFIRPAWAATPFYGGYIFNENPPEKQGERGRKGIGNIDFGKNSFATSNRSLIDICFEYIYFASEVYNL